MKSYPLYINGVDVETNQWTYVISASSFIADKRLAFRRKRDLELGKTNEITADVVGRCAIGSDQHNHDAIDAAAEAGRTYRTLFPLSARLKITREINDRIAEKAAELIEILVAEGHPRTLARWEVSGMFRGCDHATIDWYESQLSQEFQDGTKKLRLVRKADGVVCINPPQNAAGSNAALGILALMSGNSLVVKAPKSTPLSVMFVYREIVAPVLDRHGVPKGTLNIISGGASSVIETWIASPKVATVLFFGDSALGLQVGVDCYKAGKKAVLELAGNDGFVVWKDADLEAAARALEESFYGSSQICMVPKYAIVHPEIADRFLSIFLDRVKSIKPGYPEDDDILLSPVLKVDKFMDFLSEAKNSGAEVLCGGARVDVDGLASPTGLFLEPTVLRVRGLEAADKLSCVREETFFPLLPIVVPSSDVDETLLDDILQFMNQNKYGLRNSLWTTGPEIINAFENDLNNGGLLKINDSHIGFVSYLATHGGTGLTGGPHGELNYVGLRTTHLQGIVHGDSDPRPLDTVVFA